jgi:hypothetical protein
VLDSWLRRCWNDTEQGGLSDAQGHKLIKERPTEQESLAAREPVEGSRWEDQASEEQSREQLAVAHSLAKKAAEEDSEQPEPGQAMEHEAEHGADHAEFWN